MILVWHNLKLIKWSYVLYSLYKLYIDKILNSLMLKDEIIYEMLIYIESFREKSIDIINKRILEYKNFKQHVIASFLILKNIFVNGNT